MIVDSLGKFSDLNRGCAALLILAAMLSGCGETTSTTQRGDKAEFVKNSALPPIDPRRYLLEKKVDSSLTTYEYMKLGMPDPKTSWSSLEIKEAYRVLAALAESDPSRLPRFESAASGEVFSRMIARDNSTGESPIETTVDEMRDRFDYCESLKEINKLYIVAMLSRNVSPLDWIEVSAAMARGMAKELDCLRDLLASLSVNELLDPVRVQGEKTLKLALRNLTESYVALLAGMDSFQSPIGFANMHGPFEMSDRVRLAQHMKEWLPRFYMEMEVTDQQPLFRKLDHLREHSDHEVLRPTLDVIVAKLRSTPGSDVLSLSQLTQLATYFNPLVELDGLSPLGFKTTRGGEGDLDEEGYCMAKASDGTFSVEFPGYFGEVIAVSATRRDAAPSIRFLQSVDERRVRFTVIKFSGSNWQFGEQWLLSVADRMLGKTEVIPDRAVAKCGFKGLAFSVSEEKATTIAQTYATATTLFIIYVDAPGSVAILDSDPDIARFFESFQIILESDTSRSGPKPDCAS